MIVMKKNVSLQDAISSRPVFGSSKKDDETELYKYSGIFLHVLFKKKRSEINRYITIHTRYKVKPFL